MRPNAKAIGNYGLLVNRMDVEEGVGMVGFVNLPRLRVP